MGRRITPSFARRLPALRGLFVATQAAALVTLAGCGGSGSNAASGDGPGGATSNASIAGEVSMPNPTLQNLTLEWAFTGDANANAEVTLRYRVAGASSWSTGAPLRRIAAGSTGGFSWATR
ncbi:MAG TPA: hypothetical protein PKE61_04450, partial [Burkholderiaceae bacterium]|nr:hypothetical protein [Burkholderiaceae bacterium]